ncbi:EF-P lysine aminoacylase GenX [Ectothiorhodospira sp. A-7Y]|nr:EF-P lysine aminoacylase EpmA [Ectothiorhodospira lacustris]MCG5509981.1 EF-P lysine aminoacylase GenX [Ectothiorhodospira lacustris]MCG5521727.1 EF-P lysine aminoacylase GenX [Ectothiorhodospira lacustris]
MLRRRADLLRSIRDFFHARGVLEVETPCLSRAGATDPAIESLAVTLPEGCVWLHTSPEFPMKRLLAAGAGDIYQIARVFRAGEAGRFHNPEFTLLEWYRVGFDHHRLMAEVDDLVRELAGARLSRPTGYLSYRQAMLDHAGIDPLSADVGDLAIRARALGLDVRGELDRDGWLDLIMSMVVAPALPADGLTFIHDYPASQAALARICPENPAVAERFELYWGGVELANGFHELGDAAEQGARFEADNRRRRDAGQPAVAVDHHLLSALASGLPDCAGVALGVDRLLMCLSGCDHIRQVLAFDWERA